jgi:hypothetical protein
VLGYCSMAFPGGPANPQSMLATDGLDIAVTSGPAIPAVEVTQLKYADTVVVDRRIVKRGGKRPRRNQVGREPIARCCASELVSGGQRAMLSRYRFGKY